MKMSLFKFPFGFSNASKNVQKLQKNHPAVFSVLKMKKKKKTSQLLSHNQHSAVT